MTIDVMHNDGVPQKIKGAVEAVASIRPFRCSESVVLPVHRESVRAVAVFEFVVAGLADQALPFFPRRELIASRLQ